MQYSCCLLLAYVLDRHQHTVVAAQTTTYPEPVIAQFRTQTLGPDDPYPLKRALSSSFGIKTLGWATVRSASQLALPRVRPCSHRLAEKVAVCHRQEPSSLRNLHSRTQLSSCKRDNKLGYTEQSRQTTAAFERQYGRRSRAKAQIYRS